MAPHWGSKWSDSDEWDTHPSGAEKRRERRKYAETIDSKLADLQNVVSKLSMCFDQMSQHISQNQWLQSQHHMSVLGKLDSVSNTLLQKPSDCNNIKYVEVPKFIEIPRFMEMPRSAPCEAAYERPLVVDAQTGREQNLENTVTLPDMVPRWSSIVQRAIVVHRRQKNREEIHNACAQDSIDEIASSGEWFPLTLPLQIGNIIRIEKDFLVGDDHRIDFKTEMIGVVETIDGDGDGYVRFPAFATVTNKMRWISKRHFAHLHVCKSHLERVMERLSLTEVANSTSNAELTMPTV